MAVGSGAQEEAQGVARGAGAGVGAQEITHQSSVDTLLTIVPTSAAALEDASSDPVTTPGTPENFWYPTWETWKFRRTLAYWISIMYLEGSILFIAGAAFSMSDYLHDVEGDAVLKSQRERALVTTPYFVGGICFTIGCYCGILEVVNLQNDGDVVSYFFTGPAQWRRLAQLVDSTSMVAVIANFAGAVFFNIDTILSFSGGLTWFQSTFIVWGSATLGGIGFTIGGWLECKRNKVWNLEMTTAVWWLSVLNFFGGALFLIAGLAGMFGATAVVAIATVDVPYFIGSVFFAIGAEFALWMWKCEQYGLGLLPEINNSTRTQRSEEAVLSMHAEYGCGKATAWQMPWLTLYQVNATASVLDAGMALCIDQDRDFPRLFGSFLNFALSHGILLLGSVIHHVPTAKPHNWLLIYMRVCLLMYTVNSWYEVLQHLASLPQMNHYSSHTNSYVV